MRSRWAEPSARWGVHSNRTRAVGSVVRLVVGVHEVARERVEPIEAPASLQFLAVHPAPSFDRGELLERDVGVCETLVLDGHAPVDESLDRSVTSHTLTSSPPRAVSASQKAMNSPLAGSPRKTTRSQVRAKPEYSCRCRTDRRRSTAGGLGVATEHVARGGRPLVKGIGPVLDADPPPVKRVVGIGDIAGGEHAGRAGSQVLVDEDPIIHGDSGLRGEFDPRLHPDPDDHEVALDARPSLVRTRSTALSPSKLSTPVPMSICTPCSAWISR